MSFKQINIKKLLITILWVVIGVGTVVLSVAAMKRQSGLMCKGIQVDISGVSNNFFIDNKDVLKIINDFLDKPAEGTPVSDFNLRSIEREIEKDVWVDNAELFFDRNNVLQVNVEEREPVARVFTRSGSTFYIDSAALMLPVSNKFSARLPVFTGFPTDAKVLTPVDSTLLSDIKKISIAIQTDSFLMAMIDQVDISADRNFEMTPKLGNQQIIFGDGTDIDDKFKKLKLFYKEVISKSGWSKYSVINLQYKDQIVAKVKGKEDVTQDSLKTLQMMNYMAINAAIEAADSLRVSAPGNDNGVVDASVIQQSFERDDEGVDVDIDDVVKPALIVAAKAPVLTTVSAPAKTIGKPTVKKTIVPKGAIKPSVKPVIKPADKKPVIAKPKTKPADKKPAVAKPPQKPKAVMPKNDY